MTEGAREGVWRAGPPGMFRVSNAVADLGIDGRGLERGSGGLPGGAGGRAPPGGSGGQSPPVPEAYS